MRKTLTLDDDVVAKVRSEIRVSGRSFREIVNETLRRSLASRRIGEGMTPFKVSARDLGELRRGLTLDSISDLDEQGYGPFYR